MILKTIEQIQSEIAEWAKAKNLTTATDQLLKCFEEAGELVSAELKDKPIKEVIDGVGDTLVPLLVAYAILDSPLLVVLLPHAVEFGAAQSVTGARKNLLSFFGDAGRLCDIALGAKEIPIAGSPTPMTEADVLQCLLTHLAAYAHLRGLDLLGCVNYAWEQVSRRTGRVVNGVLVKDPGQDEMPPLPDFVFLPPAAADVF